MNHYSSAPFTNDLQRVFLLTLVLPMAVRVPQARPAGSSSLDLTPR